MKWTLLTTVGACILIVSAPAQKAQIQRTVKPDSESGFFVKGDRSALAGDRRTVNPKGRAIYQFRLLSGMDVQMSVTAGGKGAVKVVSGSQTLLNRAIEGAVLSRTYTFRVPTTTPVQGVQVILEGSRTAGLAIYAIDIKATDRDDDGDGIGDAVERMLGAQANVLKPARFTEPRTTYQTGAAYEPKLDLQTDAVMVYSADPARITGWQNAGYIIQTMGGFRDYTPYAEANPTHVQTRQNGDLMRIESSYYLAPTADRLETNLNYYRSALRAGSKAICPEEPEYWAQAGYEEWFKGAYREQYGIDWQPPHESISSRWRADRLKAQLMTGTVHRLLTEVQVNAAHARRMVAVHSPINYAMWGICFAHHQTLLNPVVQEVIGQVWSDTARTRVPYAGVWGEHPFAMAFLEYASLVGLLRDTDKSLWFLMDPLSDVSTLELSALQRYYFDTLAAATLFPEVKRYEVLPWPERIFGRVPPDYASVILSVTRALEGIASSPAGALDAGIPDIGILFSDSMVYQRGEPHVSHLEDLLGYSMPLIKAGVPLQAVSLDRVTEPNYLRRLRLLMLSYDYQKPPSEATHEALANWIRNGGWLVVTGGSDPYNALPEGWWRRGGTLTPLEDLLRRLEVRATAETLLPEVATENAWKTLGQHDNVRQENAFNRRRVQFDLTEYAQAGKTIYIKFRDPFPDTGWGPLVSQVRLELDNRTLAVFTPGTSAERQVLFVDQGSLLNNQNARYADGNNWFVYRFTLPRGNRASLNVEIAQEWQIQISTVPPYEELNLTPMRNDLPKIRMRNGEPLTLYRAERSEPLYTYVDKPVGVSVRVGSGGIVLMGVPGRTFALDTQGADKARAWIQNVAGRAGLRYRERSRFLMQRGDWTVAYGTTRTTTLRGTYIDVLDPKLPIVRDYILNPDTPRLLKRIDSPKPLRVLHANARVVLSNEGNTLCAYLLKGPSGTPGIARIATDSRRPVIEALDINGNPVPVNVEAEARSVLVRWNMNPDGTVLRVSSGK